MLRRTQRLAAAGVVVVLLGFVGLSLGSTMAKATHAPGSVVAFWRLLIGAVLWQAVVALRRRGSGRPLLVGTEAWRLCALPGFVFGLNIALFFSGVDRTPIAHAEFISAMAPLVMVPLTANNGERIFEVACHEGNRAVEHMLEAARAAEHARTE